MSPTTTGAMASGSDAVEIPEEIEAAINVYGATEYNAGYAAERGGPDDPDGAMKAQDALKRLIAAALAAPAPVVPEEVRRLFGFAADEDWSFLYDRLGDGGRARFWKAVLGDFRTLLSAMPSGRADTPLSDKDDDSHRCGICDEPLIAGQMVLTDVELGTVHATCCGPERDGYVKDIDTGEPLGPDDPIPAGRPYEADTAPSGGGAVESAALKAILACAEDADREGDREGATLAGAVARGSAVAYRHAHHLLAAAPAAPEPAAGGGPFRVGRKVPQHVYEDDEPLFTARCPEQAERLVDLLNAGSALLSAPSEAETAGGDGLSLTAETTPIKGFPNRAGQADPDDEIAAELDAAGIKVHRFDFLRDKGEVKTSVVGDLHGWSFKRAWRYWIAEGPGIELAVADVLHAAHPATVRVDGHCGCPSPRECFKGFAVGSYHVDSPAGLKGLADAIRYIAARAAEPTPANAGAEGGQA